MHGVVGMLFSYRVGLHTPDGSKGASPNLDRSSPTNRMMSKDKPPRDHQQYEEWRNSLGHQRQRMIAAAAAAEGRALLQRAGLPAERFVNRRSYRTHISRIML